MDEETNEVSVRSLEALRALILLECVGYTITKSLFFALAVALALVAVFSIGIAILLTTFLQGTEVL